MFDFLKKRKKAREKFAPGYGLIYFDHLSGEYSHLAETISVDAKKKCEEIEAKRKNGTLKWDDIYAYQLVFAEHLDIETLKNKIISLRIKYQNLVSTLDYDNYVTLRAFDLTKSLSAQDTESLRADYQYLLDEFYLRYAYISAREDLRTKLLRYGTLLTVVFFILAAGVTLLAFITENIYLTRISNFSSTIFVVVFAGITGAFVSMQQRFQSVSNEDDPIYNLALLWHGWFSIFLTPLSGAIFAVILYLFFVSGFLTGSIFPTISTIDKPPGEIELTMEVEPDAASDEQPPSNTNVVEAPKNNANTTNETRMKAVQPKILGLTGFLPNTGPKTGKDLALLLIWSFIAGFAERFVPDTLMRLVNQKKINEGSTA